MNLPDLAQYGLDRSTLMIIALTLAVALAQLWRSRAKRARAVDPLPSDVLIGWTPGSGFEIRPIDAAQRFARWQVEEDRHIRFPLDPDYANRLYDARTGQRCTAYLGNVHTGQLVTYRLAKPAEDPGEQEWEPVEVPEVNGHLIRPVRTVEQLEMDGSYLDEALEDGREINMVRGIRQADSPGRKGWFWNLPRWQQILLVAGLAFLVMRFVG